ncbi:sigma factor [Sphaerimonospora mesophila]|uniref:sigma factor n=1 Tax=Sphaerimonospora mesophila TaxID=37483 RepID=UPI0006E1986B
MSDDMIEDLLRRLMPQVLGALVRRYGHFDSAEDAVQEALLAAATRWRTDGIPDRPQSWLIQVASRRLTDLLRSEQARRRREDVVASRVLPQDRSSPPAAAAAHGLDDADDTLIARAPARTTEHGELVPLREQDRTLWKAESIRRGMALLARALPRGPVGPYQLQAAIAAVHAQAPSEAATDWGRIVALYRLLLRMAPSPIARLNHAVAMAMAEAPATGLALLDALDDSRLARDHRLHPARAHLLEMSGDAMAAREAYAQAARYATNLRHVRYLTARTRRLDT